ncbi:MAG: BBE domain-containing protein [Candidatus Binatia bacterium]
MARLAALKRKFDATNLFRMNHNIVPAEVGADPRWPPRSRYGKLRIWICY